MIKCKVLRCTAPGVATGPHAGHSDSLIGWKDSVPAGS